jgi:hypothetical protein
MSLADMRIYTDEELAKPSPIDAYIDLVRITRPATREDVLAAVREWDGTQERQWHGPIEVMPKGRPDLGSELPPGRYLIVPLDTGDTE